MHIDKHTDIQIGDCEKLQRRLAGDGQSLIDLRRNESDFESKPIDHQSGFKSRF